MPCGPGTGTLAVHANHLTILMRLSMRSPLWGLSTLSSLSTCWKVGRSLGSSAHSDCTSWGGRRRRREKRGGGGGGRREEEEGEEGRRRRGLHQYMSSTRLTSKIVPHLLKGRVGIVGDCWTKVCGGTGLGPGLQRYNAVGLNTVLYWEGVQYRLIVLM